MKIENRRLREELASLESTIAHSQQGATDARATLALNAIKFRKDAAEILAALEGYKSQLHSALAVVQQETEDDERSLDLVTAEHHLHMESCAQQEAAK